MQIGTNPAQTYPIVDGHEQNHPTLRELGQEGEEQPSQQQPGPLGPESSQQHQGQQRHVEVGEGQQVGRYW